MSNIDIVLRIPQGKAAVVKAWLESKGVEYAKDEDGITLTKGLRILGKVNSTIRKDVVTGDKYCSIRFSEKIANKLPVKPAYIIWRSDVFDAEGNLLPWPTYSVEDTDESGAGLGTYHQQGCGGLA